jgi:hypothetical protein
MAFSVRPETGAALSGASLQPADRSTESAVPTQAFHEEPGLRTAVVIRP